MTETISKRPLTQLQHEIEEAEATAAKLEAERNAITKDISRRSPAAVFAARPVHAKAV